MKILKRIRNTAYIICIACLLAMIGTGIVAQAKTTSSNSTIHPVNGWYTDSAGHTYYYKRGKPQTGSFTVAGKRYYGHKTGSKAYPAGSVTKGQMRISSGNRWFAYRWDGVRYERDHYISKGRRRYLQLDIRSRDHTVRYVYMTSMRMRGHRYSTSRKRWQTIWDDGEWHDEGHQVIPEGWVDFQK